MGGMDHATQVGVIRTLVSSDYHAAIWSGMPASAIDLNPTGAWESGAGSVSGSSQVGSASFSSARHAALWHGTAASFVDLHPVGYESSSASDVSGSSQVGYGYGDITKRRQALMWTGTAASVVNLTPANFDEASIAAIDGNDQVGEAHNIIPVGPFDPPVLANSHAILWHGNAASATDLHPSAYANSLATAVGEGYQGGWVIGTPTGNLWHAALWNGTSASCVDLHPAGAEQSFVADIGNGYAVGRMQMPMANSYTADRAVAWTLSGGAASAVDLHALLTGLGVTFRQSYANGISSDGIIVGEARDTNGRSYAVMWTPDFLSGDLNHDETVDARDYVTWRRGVGTTYSIAEYIAWRTHFGQTAGGSASSQSPPPVPEPASYILMACIVAAAPLAHPRRHQR